MEWVEPEPVGLGGPHHIDIVVGGEAVQRLQAAHKVLGHDEVNQTVSKLAGPVVGIVLNRGPLIIGFIRATWRGLQISWPQLLRSRFGLSLVLSIAFHFLVI